MPWIPKDKYSWDFWFARREGELHVFFLQASQRECDFNPDRRHDRASVGHAVLTAWGWREVGPEPAFGARSEAAWDDRSIWTGSIVRHPDTGLFHMFYTARCNQDAPIWTPHEWQRPQQVGVATSRDLIEWKRTEASLEGPVIRNPGPDRQWDGVNWRDPYLIREPDGNWHAFVCARPPSREGRHVDDGGIIAYLTSPDLELWDGPPEVLVQSDEFYQLEVPQVFWRRQGGGKRLYLVFCAQEKDCSRIRRQTRPDECETGTYYLCSELVDADSAGFPELPGPARLLAPGWFAGRLLDPEGDTPMFYGFQWADEGGRFVGGLSDPMPVRLETDGTLALQSESW